MTPLLDALLEPFRHAFMLRAMGVGAFVCAVCAALSPFVVLKRWSLVGDAVSHAVLPGIIGAYLVGLPMALGAVATGTGSVLAAGVIDRRARVKPDAALGIAFTGFTAVGLILLSKVPSDIHFMHVIFGNLLGVETEDLVQAVAVGCAVLAGLVVFGRDLVLVCFDPAQARIVGLRPDRLEMLLLLLVAMTAVAALQAVGVVLALAAMIIPGCTGLLAAKRFGRVVAVSVGAATLSAVIGTLASFWLDGATGPCIVLAQAALFGLAAALRARRGRSRPA